MKKKKCFKCGKTKPLSEFYKHKRMADGHLNKCKACTKKDVKVHRDENIEKIRQYDRDRSRTEKRKRLNAERTKKYRERFPERYKAHNAVNYALRSKKITKPSKCEGCGEKGVHLHAHHTSYEQSHWLDVEWLCTVCHSELHHE